MKRNDFIDVIKGLNIFCVVIGHAVWELNAGSFIIPVGSFVYLFHLACFFFCAGYLFRIDDDFKMKEYVAKRIKSLYLPFIKSSFIYLVIRNLFIASNILDGTPFSFSDYIVVITNLITFNGVGELLAPFWFLPVMFWSMILFAILFFVTYRMKKSLQFLLRLMFILLFGYIGLYTTEHFYTLLYNMQIAYLMIPIVALGYIYKKYEQYISRYVNVITTVVAFTILVEVIYSNMGIIELSNFSIIDHWIFYPVTLAGIWFCLGIGKVISKITAVKNFCSSAGRKSFRIMAWHIACFKLIDLGYSCIFKISPDNLAEFPHSFSHLWPIYIFVGIMLPLGLDGQITKLYQAVIKRKAAGK